MATDWLQQRRDEMLARIDGLEPQWWHDALRVLAVLQQVGSRTAWQQAVAAAGIRDARGNIPSVGAFEPLVKQMSSERILAGDPQRPQVSPLVREPLAKRAVQAGEYIAFRGSRRDQTFWVGRDDGGDTEEGFYLGSIDAGMVAARHALYEKRFVRANAICMHVGATMRKEWLSSGRFHAVFTEPFDPSLLEHLSHPVRYDIMRAVMLKAQFIGDVAPVAAAWLRERLDTGGDPTGWYALCLGEHLLLMGQREETHALAERCGAGIGVALKGCLAALDGQYGQADAAFEQSLKTYRRLVKQRLVCWDGLSGVLHAAALLRLATVQSLSRLHGIVAEWQKSPGTVGTVWQGAFGAAWDTTMQTPDIVPWGPPGPDARSLAHLQQSVLLSAVCQGYWRGDKGLEACVSPLKDLAEWLAQTGWPLMASEAMRLAAIVAMDDTLRERAEKLRAGLGGAWIVESYVRKAPWERTLDAIERLKPAAQGVHAPAAKPQKRFAWMLSRDRNEKTVKVVELVKQSLLRSGRWSAGKHVLKPYSSTPPELLQSLGDQDRRALSSLEALRHGYSFVQPDLVGAVLADLAGSPAVYWDDDPDTPVEIVLRPPALHVERRGKSLRLQVEPVCTELGIAHEIDGPYHLWVTRFTREQLGIARMIGNGVDVPVWAEKRLAAVMAAIAPRIAVESDAHEGLPTVAADARPVVRIAEDRGLIHVTLHCRPAPDGALAWPGKGRRVTIGMRDGVQVGFERDLKAERTMAAPVESLVDQWLDEAEDGYAASDEAHALEFMLGLGQLGDTVTVEWARGTPLRVSREADTDAFRGKVRKERDWFALEGTLPVDEKQVLELAALMELVSLAPGSRFVKLDNGEYLALTERFRRRLQDLSAIGSVHGRGVRLAPAAALWAGDAVDELAGSGLSTEWVAHAARIRTAMAATAATPGAFQGELREYQLEGFQWLHRLSLAGFGACLADDMGLGKTVQALALLLTRAPQGPALVVAPTSVCAGWQSEIARFTPSLTPRLFAEADRTALVAEAGPNDVVICSYGLLLQDEEGLCSREWSTVILDEAQAIKNMQTRRSQAAMRLRAGFRIAMSGTPVENHLGELWTIMQFVNPGLLGSAKQFARSFVAGAGTAAEHESRKRLRRLISPFVLRRTKGQVLEELPRKTEIAVVVEMDPEESSFYEALRRLAVKELTGVEADLDKGRMRILAAITRLRRACCNPRIVDPATAVPSSKMQAFEEKVTELVENGHRALVFSQFVDHLSLLREGLDRVGVRYQYLDGSTPAAQRVQAVSTFQGGTDPLFLISLRAGGFGLNLTAADYVFIMDPWWNPAVEDQASDRAHRIGQERPVTIYRFVARGTIEEKIIALHRDKRDLAESVLDGAEGAARISAEELLGLLREGAG